MSLGLGKNLRCDRPSVWEWMLRVEIEENGWNSCRGLAGYGIYIKLSRGGGAERS